MSDHHEVTHRITIEFKWNHRALFGLIAILIVVIALSLVATALARIGSNVVSPSPALTASTVVSYQGRVSVSNQPFNGNGQFKFAIVNANGNAGYWSNDGTGLSTAPFTPTSSVALNVSNGLFNVLLGDTSLPNMTQPMMPDAFSAPDRLLRVWFNDGTHGFQQLMPDVHVASAPYALNAEFARTSPNLQQIALLKWYTAISTTKVFTVGLYPSEIAFDGENLWVSNYPGDLVNSTVSVLRARDGALVGTYPAGLSPQGIAYDGANMWIANSNAAKTVTVLRASDGVRVMTQTVGTGPLGIAFDGSNMWVTNFMSDTVSVLRASDGFHIMTPTVGVQPYGLAFDGVNMWVANFGGGFGNTVSVLRGSDGAHVMTITVGLAPRHLAFDGINMWVTNEGSQSVSVIRASDGFHVMTPTVGVGPIGIAFDGTNMWVANGGLLAGNTVSVLRASDGALIATLPVGLSPSGIAFDGANMWVTNYGDGTVSKR
jgi:DNA-binding beta-propeller fold protein YncE